jgi:hypothetical protein
MESGSDYRPSHVKWALPTVVRWTGVPSPPNTVYSIVVSVGIVHPTGAS